MGMKNILLPLLFVGFVACSTPASADHTDNGECLDEIKHFQSLLKTTSADDSTKNSAKDLRDAGNAKRITGKEADCETIYKQAIDLID